MCTYCKKSPNLDIPSKKQHDLKWLFHVVQTSGPHLRSFWNSNGWIVVLMALGIDVFAGLSIPRAVLLGNFSGEWSQLDVVSSPTSTKLFFFPGVFSTGGRDFLGPWFCNLIGLKIVGCPDKFWGSFASVSDGHPTDSYGGIWTFMDFLNSPMAGQFWGGATSQLLNQSQGICWKLLILTLRLDYQSFSAKQPMKIMNNKWKQLAINKY